MLIAIAVFLLLGILGTIFFLLVKLAVFLVKLIVKAVKK